MQAGGHRQRRECKQSENEAIQTRNFVFNSDMEPAMAATAAAVTNKGD